ncbi:MAG: hypothetical protein GX213_07515 [Clostridiaceae bacterium]|nr:hypothetical protein [Clostridiaceae bacterium]
MKVRRRLNKSGNSINIFVILAIIIVVGISIIILVRNLPGTSNPTPVLEEGKDYDINHSRQSIYTIVDEAGNTIELERISADVFQDRKGKRYKFVSGSPFKYIGEDKD